MAGEWRYLLETGRRWGAPERSGTGPRTFINKALRGLAPHPHTPTPTPASEGEAQVDRPYGERRAFSNGFLSEDPHGDPEAEERNK